MPVVGRIQAVSQKAGPVTRAWLANQIRGFRIPARSEAWEKNIKVFPGGRDCKIRSGAFWERQWGRHFCTAGGRGALVRKCSFFFEIEGKQAAKSTHNWS